MHRARPFKLTAFEQEAAAEVEKARQASRKILEDAAKEAEKVREQAYRDGFEKGFREGTGKAAAEERERVAKETAGLADLLGKIGRQIEAKRRALEASAEQDLVGLAVAIAEKIVRREVERGEPVTVENVRRAITLTAHRRSLDILLHKDDVKLIKTYVPALKKEFLDVADVRLRADESVSRGGCVVVTREGAVDADIRTQLEEIERQLLS